MNEIKLILTMDETNLLLEALGEMPFRRVFSVVSKIQQQAAPQVVTQPEDNGQTKESKDVDQPVGEAEEA